ncbi:hypothetical protein BDW59DRAFT_163564 [Aspergillus cavernicola]|uniref:DUF7770 domain-containing protein n=1 Tax=Aspergillus cavernicola TaxID=176166 RepID=A0ABR4I652_9EURO
MPPPTTRPVTEADKCQILTGIRVVVHNMGYRLPSDTRSLNHASIFLVITSTQSIRLNMVRMRIEDATGTVQITHCEYINPFSAIQNFTLRVSENITVDQCLKTLFYNWRDHYRLVESGAGCRFWVATMIEDFEQAGYIESSSGYNAASLKEFLQYNYSVGSAPTYDPMVPGSFDI